ncbi:MAG: hypothetical protein ABGW97_16860 [Christiangramia sp.]|uniref:hypothetical protein n=1 Tax=Christiangramia sp. TaxID=1931228 RepID=UPI0032423722
MKSKILCITGMHRSGTSLTASWLQKCGLHLDNGNLMGRSIGNIKGHFEDLDFVNVHSRIIKKKIPCSNGWIVDDIDKIFFQEEDLKEVNKLLKVRNEKFDIWGWKDPRSTLFLNQWKMIKPDLKFIIVWRNPYEVVNSLKSRYKKSNNTIDKISLIKAYKVWINYNTSILNFYKLFQDDCILINIKDLFSMDKDILDYINYRFDINLRYYPIKKLVENNLLSDYEPFLRDKLIAAFLKIKNLENELTSLSFKK